MTSFIQEATSRRLPRSLTCCVPSLTAHMLHVKLLREDGFCDAARLQHRDTFELHAWQASSRKRHSSAVASKLDLLCTQVSRLLMRMKSHGSPNSFALRKLLSRCSGNPQSPHSPKSTLKTFENCAEKKSCLRSKIHSSYTGISCLMMQLRLA